MKGVWKLAGIATLMAASGLAVAGETGNESTLVRRAIHVCAVCHGDEGQQNKDPSIPKLAGQQPRYTVAQLKAFRDQKRQETDSQAYMWGISALLDDDSIQGLADYYAAQTPMKGKPGNAALMKKGKQIFDTGIPDKGIKACAGCHSENGQGAEVFPRIAGQHATYLKKQLEIFRTKLRPHGIVMNKMTKDLSPDEIRAVAEYVQSM